jgi:hypothetical protein
MHIILWKCSAVHAASVSCCSLVHCDGVRFLTPLWPDPTFRSFVAKTTNAVVPSSKASKLSRTLSFTTSFDPFLKNGQRIEATE